MTSTGLIRSTSAIRKAVIVWVPMPSMLSTTTIEPSVTRRAVVTAAGKSRPPGESMILIRNSLVPVPWEVVCLLVSSNPWSSTKQVENAVDLTVAPLRSGLSSFCLVSVRYMPPATPALLDTKVSVNVDLPWPLWATTDMFRTFVVWFYV